MSTEATQLPLIKVVRVFAKEKRPERPENRLVWGTQLKLSQEDMQLRHIRACNAHATRPLGMLPHKRRAKEWAGLSLLTPDPTPPVQLLQKPQKPFIPLEHLPKALPQPTRQQYIQSSPPAATSPPPPPPATSNSNEHSQSVISARVVHREKPKPLFRFPASSNTKPVKPVIEDDEYLDVLAQVDMHHLYSNEMESKHCYQSLFPNAQELMSYQEAKSNLSGGNRKSAKWGRTNANNGSNMLEYISFIGQSQLNRRHISSDIRDAMEYEPCERCRLRGTRCSRCIAIRTGGGYIILDGLASDSGLMRNKAYRKGWEYGGGGSDSFRAQMRWRGKLGGNDSGLSQSSFYRNGGERGDDDGGGGGSGRLSRRWNDGGLRVEDWDGGRKSGIGLGFGDNAHRTHLETGNDIEDSTDGRDKRRLNATVEQKGLSSGSYRDFDKGSNNNLDRMRNTTETKEMGGDYDDSTRERSNRIGSSRPQPSLKSAVPGSARERDGGGKRARKLNDEDDGKGINLHVDKTSSRGRRTTGGEEGSDDKNKEGGGEKRGKKRPAAESKHSSGDNEGSRDLKSRKGTGSQNLRMVKEGDEEDEESERSYRDLMKFKSKRDNVKVKEVSLKELQGIDPLDYLAKYCIIDQTKVPHYQQVFDKVDRDEDELITIQELDFALRAVNYNLISDSEMTYINSILELAGRYALNFQLFSLVAALSEKVVALEDMVKRLINKMDFEALETKMKKCKELFYLLANDKEGVVTTRDLSVELQAGGLTAEHVDFVTDRLNYEGRGTVQFLDYLTYVPLFIEIHDNINDNPLDFSRNR